MMDHHGSLLVTSDDDWSLQPPGEGDPPRLAMGPNLRRWWLGIYSIHIIVGTCYYLHFIIHFHPALTKQSKKTYRNQSGLKPWHFCFVLQNFKILARKEQKPEDYRASPVYQTWTWSESAWAEWRRISGGTSCSVRSDLLEQSRSQFISWLHSWKRCFVSV